MIIDVLLLLLLVVCAIVVIEMMDLLSATIIMGAYSLIMAIVWTRLNAVDVAFTEATVGAGITTVLLLAALSRTRRGEEQLSDSLSDDERASAKKTIKKHNIISRLIVFMTGAMLVYGTMGLPDFGDPHAPANRHVAPYMLEHGKHDTLSDNIVTSILASYRGYDTLGETAVVFTAALCVLLILRRNREEKEKSDE
ncbi:MAG: DUF4040 domain-containing protein [Deltaproteobacteria bacterium]|nr:DUF4040 domain-containing protein [Deltaproteobacteria bacterium]